MFEFLKNYLTRKNEKKLENGNRIKHFIQLTKKSLNLQTNFNIFFLYLS